MAWYSNLLPTLRAAHVRRGSASAAELLAPQGVKRIAAHSLAESVRNTPKGRISKPVAGDWSEMFTYLKDSFKGYPDEDATDLIGVLRMATQSDDDLAGSLRDMQALVNTGFVWEFVAGSRATKQAGEELELWGQHVYPGGLHVFVNNQTRECYVSGASSAEWVPTPNRKAVSEAVVVVRETIVPVRDKKTGRLVYEQRHLGGDIRLHPMTYRYQPIETEGEGFHGLPVAISAPATLARKTGILTGVQKIINLMSRSALVQALVPAPTPQELGFTSDQEAGFADATADYYKDIADLLGSATELGQYIGPAGIELKATPLTQSAGGIAEVMDLNSKGVWNSAATMPFLRGDVSANYALARVMYPFLTAVAENIQRAIALQLEHGANLHLRLMGIPAQAFVKWNPRPNAFALDDASAKKANADADEKLLKMFGDAYAVKLMANWDIADADFKAKPEWWAERNGKPVDDNPDDPEKGGDDGSKI